MRLVHKHRRHFSCSPARAALRLLGASPAGSAATPSRPVTRHAALATSSLRINVVRTLLLPLSTGTPRMSNALAEAARRLALFLEAFLEASCVRPPPVPPSRRWPAPSGASAFWRALDALAEADEKLDDKLAEFLVEKPRAGPCPRARRRSPGAVAATRFVGGAALGAARAVATSSSARSTRPSARPTWRARRWPADDAPMPSAHPAVSSRPRLGDGRSESYLLQVRTSGRRSRHRPLGRWVMHPSERPPGCPRAHAQVDLRPEAHGARDGPHACRLR